MQAKYMIVAAGLVVASPLAAAPTSTQNQGMHPTVNATGQTVAPSSKCGGGCCPGATAQTTSTEKADMQAQSANQQPHTSNMQAQNADKSSTKRAFFC